MIPEPRVIAWFSAGAASAVATKLALRKYGRRVVVARLVIDSEHPDNERFAQDCQRWFGAPIKELRSGKYRDHWQVMSERRFISGHAGALCTTELKKIPRLEFQRYDDIHVFGYTSDKRDAKRADRFREQNPDFRLETPLIDESLTKEDCIAIVANAGIAIPTMYRLGFTNNNCVGCAKATSPTYWNRIRKYFPEAFDRMARQQREINYTQVKLKGEPTFLDELPDEVIEDEEPDIECGLFCHGFEGAEQ